MPSDSHRVKLSVFCFQIFHGISPHRHQRKISENISQGTSARPLSTMALCKDRLSRRKRRQRLAIHLKDTWEANVRPTERRFPANLFPAGKANNLPKKRNFRRPGHVVHVWFFPIILWLSRIKELAQPATFAWKNVHHFVLQKTNFKSFTLPSMLDLYRYIIYLGFYENEMSWHVTNVYQLYHLISVSMAYHWHLHFG